MAPRPARSAQRRLRGPRGQLAEEILLSRLEDALARVKTDLAELNRRWALVGGLAVSTRTTPRFTRGLDVAVAVPDDAAAESLVSALVKRGYAVVLVTEHETTGRMATVRVVPPGETQLGVVVDLLFASSGIGDELVSAAEPMHVFESLVVPVARSGHLLALKVLSRDDHSRPQDSADIRSLVDGMDPADASLALEAARLIEARGFNRSRNVLGDVETALT